MTTTAPAPAHDARTAADQGRRNRWAAPLIAAAVGAGAAAATAWWLAGALQLSMGMGAGL